MTLSAFTHELFHRLARACLGDELYNSRTEWMNFPENAVKFSPFLVLLLSLAALRSQRPIYMCASVCVFMCVCVCVYVYMCVWKRANLREGLVTQGFTLINWRSELSSSHMTGGKHNEISWITNILCVTKLGADFKNQSAAYLRTKCQLGLAKFTNFPAVAIESIQNIFLKGKL